MDTAKQRLFLVIERKGFTTNSFEKKVGLSNGSVYHAKDTLSPQMLGRISLAFPDINIEWLQYGVGEMLKSQNASETYTANGDNAIAGRNISVPDNSALKQENADLRAKLDAANEKIRQLQDELLALYRKNAN